MQIYALLQLSIGNVIAQFLTIYYIILIMTSKYILMRKY